MSLTINLMEVKKVCVHWVNITHNLTEMAREVKINDATLYHYLWRPEEVGIKEARDLIVIILTGYAILKNDPERYKKYNARNYWGTYTQFLRFLNELFDACMEHPNAEIEVSR